MSAARLWQAVRGCNSRGHRAGRLAAGPPCCQEVARRHGARGALYCHRRSCHHNQESLRFLRAVKKKKHDYYSKCNFDTAQVASNRASKIARLSKLWVPINKSLVLSGVITDSRVVRDAQDISITLGQEWAPTFAHKPVPVDEAKVFLESVSLPAPPPLTSIPSFRDFVQILKRLAKSTSAPGPDGIPYSAWYYGGPKAWVTLYRILKSLAAGTLPPSVFNASLLVFLPKGESEFDAQEVIRKAQDTRPISLKNSDNKTVTGALVSPFQSFAKKHTHRNQNGFVHGRFFLRNVLDLDSASRIFSMHWLNQRYDVATCPGLIPLLAFYDCAVAFPSIAHPWIFLCLESRKFPEWFISALRGIYYKAAAYANHDNELVFCFFFQVFYRAAQPQHFYSTCLLTRFCTRWKMPS